MRKIGLLLSFLMIFTVFAGCSDVEKEYWSKAKGYYQWEGNESTQKVSFSMKAGTEEVKMDMEINSKTNLKDETSEIEIKPLSKVNGKDISPLKMYVKGADIYISKKAIEDVIKAFDEEVPAELKAISEEYIGISSKDMMKDTPGMENYKPMTMTSPESQKFLALLEDIFKNTEFGMTKNGDTYELKMDSDKMIDVLDIYIAGVINNMEKFGEITGMDQSAIAEMTEAKAEMLKMYETQAKPMKELIKAQFKGSYFNTKEVLKDSEYANNTDMLLKTEGFEMSLKMEGTAKKNTSITVDIPKSVKIIDLEELMPEPVDDGMPQPKFMDAKNELAVNLNGDMVFFGEEDLELGKKIDVQIIDGASYLPLREVAEKFKKEVNFNAQGKYAYATIDGKEVKLEGKIINGMTYVKVRELEKLNLKVDWDQERSTIHVYEL